MIPFDAGEPALRNRSVESDNTDINNIESAQQRWADNFTFFKNRR
ncbi:hypothetical protein H4V96_003656 [Janthinobacterium sp. CG_23.4]|nr:hypothetical protein [Janthinobacterium sp. CG_23.4]